MEVGDKNLKKGFEIAGNVLNLPLPFDRHSSY